MEDRGKHFSEVDCMNKLDILKNMNIGNGVTEQEAEHIQQFFVETDQWRRILKGEYDIIFGQKGSGKSALFSFLNEKEYEMIDQGIIVLTASNVRGDNVFSKLKDNPIPSPKQFESLWKLYILATIAGKMKSYGAIDNKLKALIVALEQAGLIPRDLTLDSIFSAVIKKILRRALKDPEAVEYTISLSETGVPSAISRKTTYGKDSQDDEIDIPIDNLLSIINDSLKSEGMTCWVAFDRLDAAFDDNEELEGNALTALFKAYNGMQKFDNIKLKIFVRDDIWDKIVSRGFREASHIVKHTTISWDKDGLLDLLLRRMLNNDSLIKDFSINIHELLSSADKKRELFYSIFPDKVETGPKKPATLDWIVSRLSDGKKNAMPRNLIIFAKALIDNQIKSIEKGESLPEASTLFDRRFFKDALSVVSKQHYTQTLKAEHPSLSNVFESFKKRKTEHNITTLAEVLRDVIPADKTQGYAELLVKLGFFEARGDRDNKTYWVAFLYRDALEMVQGKAFSSAQQDQAEDE